MSRRPESVKRVGGPTSSCLATIYHGRSVAGARHRLGLSKEVRSDGLGSGPAAQIQHHQPLPPAEPDPHGVARTADPAAVGDQPQCWRRFRWGRSAWRTVQLQFRFRFRFRFQRRGHGPGTERIGIWFSLCSLQRTHQQPRQHAAPLRRPLSTVLSLCPARPSADRGRAGAHRCGDARQPRLNACGASVTSGHVSMRRGWLADTRRSQAVWVA